MLETRKNMPAILVADPFIAKALCKPSWRVTVTDGVTANLFSDGPDGFVYAKVDCADTGSIKLLEDVGFHLIDTNTQFARPKAEPWPVVELPAAYGLRFAEPGDAAAVEKVAANSFTFTRFHLDRLVSDQMANDVKRQWAGNFFKGKRGDWMVVPTFRGEAVGFLQLLSKGDTIIIDLIAVNKAHRGKGLATAMIEFAARQCGKWNRMLVGTQVANIPSIRAYEKLHFRMCGSSYVFHYHGPVTT